VQQELRKEYLVLQAPLTEKGVGVMDAKSICQNIEKIKRLG
tara:strand:- start:3214 stop:3336 length:123 start_codon:yes stop_codon:yes gene_type:complete